LFELKNNTFEKCSSHNDQVGIIRHNLVTQNIGVFTDDFIVYKHDKFTNKVELSLHKSLFLVATFIFFGILDLPVGLVIC